MSSFIARKFAGTPLSARVAPFLIFYALTLCQGRLGADSQYWFYFGKTIVGAWLVWSLRDVIEEMKWRLSWEGVVAGVVVIALWIGLEGHYPSLSTLTDAIQGKRTLHETPVTWNPPRDFGAGTFLAWFFIVVRIVGSTLVVPPLEEVFYRSFLYRYVVSSDFLAIPLRTINWRALVMAGGIFALSHNEWLPAFLCAVIFQGLVFWKGRLGDAMTAHAVANFLLGLWVVWKGAWNFW